LGWIRTAPDHLIRLAGDRERPQIRIMAQREIGLRTLLESHPTLLNGLASNVPGVRRSAAWALGRCGQFTDAESLLAAVQNERVDVVRFAMGMAAVNCGADALDVRAHLERASRRQMKGAYGARDVGEYAGFGLREIADCWGLLELSAHTTRNDFRARAREVLGFDDDNRDSVIRLALVSDPADFDVLKGMWRTSGRRMRLTLTRAKGLHGDPRWIPSLLQSLFAMDVDPGHGFALRSEAALALGRIGVPSLGHNLVHALEVEALEQEGRPGAGLGIQRSVRTALLAALGELQSNPKALVQYLDNTHGTAGGGHYLPAMDALWKVGATTDLRRVGEGKGMAADNAKAVLAALSV
jgi:HEAT repeat protein